MAAGRLVPLLSRACSFRDRKPRFQEATLKRFGRKRLRAEVRVGSRGSGSRGSGGEPGLGEAEAREDPGAPWTLSGLGLNPWVSRPE